MISTKSDILLRYAITRLVACCVLFPSIGLATSASAQEIQDGSPESVLVDDVLGEEAINSALPGSPDQSRHLNVLDLVIKGGWLMIPIGLMSVMVVALAIERSLALRRKKVMPSGLMDGLSELASVPGVMDPRRAYAMCQMYPSATSSVIRSMLLKIGRPHVEVEHAVAEASNREAARLYANVRWLNLVAAIAPLMGLFGTVWGMIRCFFDTTQLPAGQNKADFLAQGIYVALVTTLGGLAVAIPAAIIAHYFEGRIERLFHHIDELLFNLLPQIERYEGRMRVTPHTLGGADDSEDSIQDSPDEPQERRTRFRHV